MIPTFLMKKFAPKCPLVAVDVVIRVGDNVVIIEREYPPVGLALPGGMIDIGESAPAAAKREAMEEVQMDVFVIKLIGVYSDPKRDPRKHIVSIAYLCEGKGEPHAADDAKTARLISIGKIINMDMIMDHKSILLDGILMEY